MSDRDLDNLAQPAHCTGCGVTLGDSWCAACASNAKVERLLALLKEAHKELSTIEALTVSPSDTDGLLDLCHRMGEAVRRIEDADIRKEPVDERAR